MPDELNKYGQLNINFTLDEDLLEKLSKMEQ